MIDEFLNSLEDQVNSAEKARSIFEIILKNNQKELHDYIQENPLSIYDQNKDGILPIGFAIDKDLELMVEVLIKNKADVNSFVNPSNQEQQLIHLATRKRNFRIVKLLVDNGADVNSKEVVYDEKTVSNTPLHLAVENMDFNIVEFLLKNGADTNILNGKKEARWQRPIEIIMDNFKKISREQDNQQMLDDNFKLFKLLSLYPYDGLYEYIEENFNCSKEYGDVLRIVQLTDAIYLSNQTIGGCDPESFALSLDFINDNNIYWSEFVNEDLELIDNIAIKELVIPRLKVRCKQKGIGDILLDLPNEIPEIISYAVNKYLQTNQENKKQLFKDLDSCFSEIHYQRNPANFSAMSYYDLKRIAVNNYAEDSQDMRNSLTYYDQNPQYKPKNYFLYLIDPKNQKEVRKLVIEHYEVFNEIFKTIKNSEACFNWDITKQINSFLNFDKLISLQEVEHYRLNKLMQKNIKLKEQLEALQNLNKEAAIKEGKKEEQDDNKWQNVANGKRGTDRKDDNPNKKQCKGGRS
ncbi:MAG: ankyrin repeat domain-containing protein [Alphaproteobacteria bacterium]